MLPKIGFIGIGVMGKSMVRNLVKAGFPVSVYTRTKCKAEDLLHEGVTWQDTIAQCAKGKNVVITMVGYPKDVEEVYFGPSGILENADSGTYLIDMTTTDPTLSETIAKMAKDKGHHALDAPVSGGDTGAKNGTLSIMVGGEAADFEACQPVFKAMGTNINHTGGPGTGQHTKMANQIALAGVIASVCEAIAYGKKNGLDPENMLKCISSGAAGSWQMSNMAPRILKEDLDPGFFIKHYIKDLNIALSHGEELPLQITQQVRDLYCQLDKQGWGELGTQALIKNYE